MNKLDTKGTVMAETNSMQIEYSDRGLKLENFSDEMLFLEQVQLVPYNTEVLSHAKIGLDYFKQADLLMCKSYSMHSYCIHMALACYRQAIEALCFRWDWRWSVSDLLHFLKSFGALIKSFNSLKHSSSSFFCSYKKKSAFISSILILSSSIFASSPLKILISELFFELELVEEIELFKIFFDFLHRRVAFGFMIFIFENESS